MNKEKIEALQKMAKIILNDNKQITPDELLVLIKSSESNEETEIYIKLHEHLMAVKQKELIKNGIF
ncbi:MAG: hypothetical protein IJY57_04220 [Clostridia bacterium]|nr:hypothetical protein [Clostridia bacterium]